MLFSGFPRYTGALGSLRKDRADAQPSVCVIRRDGAAHFFCQQLCDGQSQPGGVPGGPQLIAAGLQLQALPAERLKLSVYLGSEHPDGPVTGGGGKREAGMRQLLIGQQDSLPGGQRVHGELVHGAQRAILIFQAQEKTDECRVQNGQKWCAPPIRFM